jgi:signal peptidase I
MFHFTKRSRLLSQLRETVAFIHKRMRIDRDLLTAKEIAFLHACADEASMNLDKKTDEEIDREIQRLNQVFEKVFPVTKDRGLRENGEIVLVAVLVAMAFRAYFLQPFRIPTGSMQPTLYGITIQRRHAEPPSTPVQILHRLLYGKKYVFIRCENAGTIRGVVRNMEERFSITPEIHENKRWFSRWLAWFFSSCEFFIGDHAYTVPVSRRELIQIFSDLLPELPRDHLFEQGEVIFNYEVINGDHLFVDRFSYNFVRPKRGDVFVFETKDLPIKEITGQFYIKRCVGLPNETIRIGNDDRIYINDVAVPMEGAFKKIYSKQGGYYGHLNFHRMLELSQDSGSRMQRPAHLLNEEDPFEISSHAYWAMGDNTRSSLDSRYLGPIPEKNLVGRAFFVYWPFGKRWGIPE